MYVFDHVLKVSDEEGSHIIIPKQDLHGEPSGPAVSGLGYYMLFAA